MPDETIDARGFLRALNEYGDARVALAEKRHTDTERIRVKEAEEKVGTALLALIEGVVSRKFAAITGEI